MSLGRRQLLKACLGATQAGLLSRLAPSVGRAQGMTDGPDKLLTLFMGGGWMSLYTFYPLDAAQTGAVIPTAFVENGEPIYFDAAKVQNLDGSSAPGALKVPVLWDEAALSQGMPDPRTGGATSPHGWAWKQHQLWSHTVAIHGVDQQTAAHAAGQVSAMCGVASSEFKSPSLHAWAAHSLFSRFPNRPIPSVWVGGPAPASLSLRSEASPARIERRGDIDFLFSNRLAKPWANLKASDVGSTAPPVQFDGGTAAGGFFLNPIEERSLKRLRSYRGQLNPGSEVVLERIHDDLVGVSRVLARDVSSLVAATQGVQYTAKPFWAPAAGGHFGVNIGGFGSDDGGTWSNQFDLALRLLKSDLCTSVAVDCQGVQRYPFDQGHSQGHRVQFAQVRATFDVVGRLLGEMKATPGKQAGKSLLDETLVVLLSDFARTWPKSGPTSDHWPANTVIFAGGGLNNNRMIGSYAVNTADPSASGFDGVPVSVREATGDVMRRPRSADVVTTALAVMGVTNVRIPGGNGEILGVRKGT